MEVHALTMEQAAYAEMMFEVGQGDGLVRGAALRRGAPDEEVGAIDESEGGENGAGVSKLDVDARGTATLYGVVHGGEIIEEKGSCVEVFEAYGEVGCDAQRELISEGEIHDDLGADEAAVVG